MTVEVEFLMPLHTVHHYVLLLPLVTIVYVYTAEYFVLSLYE